MNGYVLSDTGGLRNGLAEINGPLATNGFAGTAEIAIDGVDQLASPEALNHRQLARGVFLVKQTPATDALFPGTDPSPTSFPQPPPTPVPEPPSLLLFGTGLAGLALRRWWSGA